MPRSKSYNPAAMLETLESRQLLSDIFGSIDSSGILDPIVNSVIHAPALPAPSHTVWDSGTLVRNEWKSIGSFAVKVNGTMEVTMTGTGDADLYVRKGAPPTSTSFDCRPYLATSNETCNLAGGGTYFVAVKGYAASSNFNITITYDPA